MSNNRNGSGAHKIDGLLSKTPILKFIFQRWIVEIIARVSGSFCGTLLGRSRFGIERRVRGVFSSCYFGGTNLKIDRHLQIEGHNALKLGNDVTLYGGSHYVANSRNPITIGSGSHVGRNSVLSGLGGISIGENCSISSGIYIFSITQDIASNPEGLINQNGVIKAQVTIGNDVWIGMGAKILPGVTIGDHAVVGAGAVVNKDVEPWQIVFGVPAKPFKDRREINQESKGQQND